MSDDQTVRQLEGEIERLRGELRYAAECVGVQTLDHKALGKGRRECLVSITDRMLQVADRDHDLYPPAPRRGYPTSAAVRERLAKYVEWGVSRG